jgi:hypothetical protein
LKERIMPTDVLSLWSPQIRPTIQSPWAILHSQAEALTKQTNGLLVGRVKKSSPGDGKRESLSLEIVVPALDLYYQRVLVIEHNQGMPYPALVDAEIFRPRMSVADALKAATSSLAISGLPLQEEKKPPNQADNDEELIELVKKVLQSGPVVSVAQSLIARANDALAEKQRQETAAPTGAGEMSGENKQSNGESPGRREDGDPPS